MGEMYGRYENSYNDKWHNGKYSISQRKEGDWVWNWEGQEGNFEWEWHQNGFWRVDNILRGRNKV